MKSTKRSLVIVLIFFSFSLSAQVSIDDHYPVMNTNYHDVYGFPVFWDEFEGPDGPENDDIWWPKRHYVSRLNALFYKENSYVEDGHLIFKCIKEDIQEDNLDFQGNLLFLRNNSFHHVTSGEAWTRTVDLNDLDDFSDIHPGVDGHFEYGYFEIRAKLAIGKGMHSSFWMFGGDGVTTSELDIFEAVTTHNKSNSQIISFGTNIHFNNGDLPPCPSGQIAIPDSDLGVLSDTFNTYAVEWTPHEITWYFNNVEIRNVNDENPCGNIDLEFLVPMKIALSLGYDNHFDEESPDEGTMEIDYIRVYQKDEYYKKPTVKDINNVTVLNRDRVCDQPLYNYHIDGLYTSTMYNKEWSVVNGGQIVGPNNQNGVDVAFDTGSRSMVVELKILNGVKVISKRNFMVTTRLDPYFKMKDYFCTNNELSIDVESHHINTGNRWDIYDSDEYGSVNSSSLETAYGLNHTFTNLNPNQYYVIRHGVWDSGCNSWTEGRRIFESKLLRSFSVDSTIDYSPNYTVIPEIPAYYANDDPNVNHCWNVYDYDIVTGQAYSPAIPGMYTCQSNPVFTSFKYGRYYMIKHGVYTNCNNWKESKRVIYKANQGNDIRSYELNEDGTIPIDFSIYPNPSQKEFRISSSIEGIGNLQIYNSRGQLVKEINKIVSSDLIDVSDLQNGLYLVSYAIDNQLFKQKLIIEK